MTSCRDCKNCIHYSLCNYEEICHYDIDNIKNAKDCSFFKDRSRFVELPIIDDYGEAKLLDIAIDYCYKVAMSSDPNICVEYKAEHMRLCGWLGDLRRRIEAEQALKEREENA